MALNFGKLDFDVSLNLTANFPLDARSYFESLSAAEQAAANAEEVGSTNTAYYYGQTIAVVENNIATLYIIQPNKTLIPIGASQITIDPKQFEFDENGSLRLINSEKAENGQVLTVGVDGVLTWTTPTDTYTKIQIDEKLAAASHLSRIIVSSLDDIGEYLDKDNYDKYIFMMPTGLEVDSDKYDEYIILEVNGQKVIERVGSWEVSLDDYVTKVDLEKNYVKADGDSRLITSAEVDKLEGIAAEAEKNIINSVSTDFTVDENRQLNLNNLSQSKIIGLEEVLNSKVDRTKDADLLLTQTDRNKLNALQLDGNNLQISGTVNTSQIIDLEDWLNDNSTRVKELLDIEDNYIKGVNNEQLNVDGAGVLSIKAISVSTVTNLETILNGKADKSSLAETNAALEAQNSRLEQVENALIWNEI